MKMKVKGALLVLVLCFLFGTPGHASSRKANRYFELFKYSKAIPLYQHIVETGNENDRREATFRLADCYRLTNDVPQARSWYAKAIEFYNPEPVHFFYLGQALRTLEQYAEAEKAFLRYAQLMPNDPRGKTYAQYCREVQGLGTLPDSVEIKNAARLNSPFYDFGPVFYKEGIVFTSDRKAVMSNEEVYEWTNYGYLNIFSSDPQYFRDFWTEMSEPEKMPAIFNQTYHDGPVSFTADNNTVFLTRTLKSRVKKDRSRIITNLLQIHYAAIPYSGKIKFESLPFNNDSYSVGHPAVSRDGRKLIFSSDMPGGFGGSDLYITERQGSQWSQPINLGSKINTFGNEVFPFWHNDTTLYFSSDSHLGYGGLDLFVSFFRNGEWTAPENLLKPINSPYDDFGLALHYEKKEGFFSSNRPGGLGADDIYALRKFDVKAKKPKTPPLPEPVVTPPLVEVPSSPNSVCGYVKDKRTLSPIENATVFLLNTLLGEVLILKTDINGYYEAPVEKNVLYLAKAMMPEYFDDCINFRFGSLDAEKCNAAPRDLLLDKYALNQVFRIENIYYDLDKWFIRPDARPPLDNIVRIMNQYPINIELSSHTDCRASHEYNQRLSQRRAEAAVEYITSNGINSARLVARGYGETMLVNHCADGVYCTEAEHQANRRTEFKITSVNSQFVDEKSFDPTIFKAGDKIPVQLLDANFFSDCLLTRVDRAEAPGNENVRPAHSEPVTSVPATSVPATSAPAPPAPRAADPDTETAGIAVAAQSGPRVQEVPVAIADRKDAVKEVEPQVVNTNADDSFFTVQLKAATQPLVVDAKNFPGITDVFEKKIGVYHKYFHGKFPKLQAAVNQRSVLNNSFPGCFVVAFKEGDPVTIKELQEYLK
jgi:outer membrane protein OmpA-like peptidoglycan-associated protein